MIRCGRKALVAEDNLVSQRILVGLLRRLGYQVDVVGDGQAVLRVLSQRAYDVIVMDCQMPSVDGPEAAVAIRVREVDGAMQHTPIVAVTSLGEEFTEAKCLEAGMDAYLTKPVTLEALTEALEKTLPEGLPAVHGAVSDCEALRPASGQG